GSNIVLLHKCLNTFRTVSWLNLGNITCLPDCFMLRNQFDIKGRSTQTTWIEDFTLSQCPLIKGFIDTHGLQFKASYLCQCSMPLLDVLIIGIIHFNGSE